MAEYCKLSWNWTAKETEKLKELYPSRRREEVIKAIPNRTWLSITSKAFFLRLKRNAERGRAGITQWSGKEIGILRELYPSATYEEIIRGIPNRRFTAIRNKAHELRITRTVSPKNPPLSRLPTFQFTEVEKARLAMGIDCEGTIGLLKPEKKGFQPYISFSNTRMELLSYFKEVTRAKGSVNWFLKKSGNRRPACSLTIANLAHIYALIKEIQPYFILKGEHASLVTEFIEIQDTNLRKLKWREHIKNTPRQFEIYERLHELNRRGRERA